MIDHDLSTPEGSYIASRPDTQWANSSWTHAYTISRCTPVPTAEARTLRARTMGREFVRCDVTEMTTLTVEGVPPRLSSPLTFDRVLFGRYVSSIPRDDGAPLLDQWFGEVTIVQRRLRLFISESNDEMPPSTRSSSSTITAPRREDSRAPAPSARRRSRDHATTRPPSRTPPR